MNREERAINRTPRRDGTAQSEGDSPIFAADAALGRLAKWLRIAGFDTTYEPNLSIDGAISHVASGKTLLTRKRAVYSALQGKSVIYIQSDHYLEQIREVIRETGLASKQFKPFSRCIRCNLQTVAVPKENVAGQVPDYIWANVDAFHRCANCQQIYWRGSHTEKILTVLACF